MPDGKLIERRLDGQTLVQGNFLKVCRDRVELPDGTVTTREYVVHPGAVMIVPQLLTKLSSRPSPSPCFRMPRS